MQSSPSLCAPHSQVGRLNPAELKAQKLARSGAGGGGDRNAKPDVDERRAINAVLNYPPNRCNGRCALTVAWPCLNSCKNHIVS